MNGLWLLADDRNAAGVWSTVFDGRRWQFAQLDNGQLALPVSARHRSWMLNERVFGRRKLAGIAPQSFEVPRGMMPSS